MCIAWFIPFILLKYIMTKQKDAKVITLTYELRNGSSEGQVIEVVNDENPAEFLFGAGKLVGQFEENVIGLSANDPFEFMVPSNDAYGPVDQKAIVDLPKSVFMVDGELASDILVEGNIVNMQDQDGHPLQGKILKISDEAVKMDFNHPLAGIDLHFKGQVISTRDASPEEVAHGHVHTGHHGH